MNTRALVRFDVITLFPDMIRTQSRYGVQGRAVERGLIEIVTWGQLKFHEKRVGVLNVNGYFDKLLAYLDHAQAEGFLRPENRAMLLSDTTATGLLQQFEAYRSPAVEKWV